MVDTITSAPGGRPAGLPGMEEIEMNIDWLIRTLTMQAAEWEQTSARLEVDEPDDMDTVEDDSMSAIYGECAGFLRSALEAYRRRSCPDVNVWETVEATETATLLLVPGEEYGNTKLPDGQWAMVYGDPSKLALVIKGTRDEIMDRVVDDGRRELETYYRAEHENGLHLRSPEYHCPGCAPGEWACPNCGEVGHCLWTERGANGERLTGSWVKCYEEGATAEFPKGCKHIWQPFPGRTS